MSNSELINQVEAKAKDWLTEDYDSKTREIVESLLKSSDPTELIESFYKDLEFGTGGLRGIMGVGSNRMNKYTVGAATQGLANYINQQFKDLPERKVVIGHDCRNNSRFFAETAAAVFSANGITTYLFEDLRPTPEVSYAIRKLGCQSGVMITASHNPKEYNGYKAYWDDGAQVLAPHDKNIIDEVNKVSNVKQIKFDADTDKIISLGEDMDELFINEVHQVSLNPDVIKKQHNLKIVFSPIHGATVKIVPQALAKFGFTNIIHIPEQDVVDGNFPTVESPNPEEPAALRMATDKAKEVDADLVVASDPDGDRLGIATKNDKGEFVLINGNQTAILLTWYLISQWKKLDLLQNKEFVVKTIVTSEIIKEIAEKNGIKYFDVYTGFKWIAAIIRELEGDKKYICGGEESYGFLPGDYVRDKDAVGSICIIAELTAWAKENGKSLYDLLKDIYVEYGFSQEKLISIVRKGKSGSEEIREMMTNFRDNPPTTLGGSKVNLIKDYSTLIAKNPITEEETEIKLPEKSNVLQFFTEDGSKISVRPSGTEPKIKFYFEVKGNLEKREDFDLVNDQTNAKIDQIIKELNL